MYRKFRSRKSWPFSRALSAACFCSSWISLFSSRASVSELTAWARGFGCGGEPCGGARPPHPDPLSQNCCDSIQTPKSRLATQQFGGEGAQGIRHTHNSDAHALIAASASWAWVPVEVRRRSTRRLSAARGDRLCATNQRETVIRCRRYGVLSKDFTALRSRSSQLVALVSIWSVRAGWSA